MEKTVVPGIVNNMTGSMTNRKEAANMQEKSGQERTGHAKSTQRIRTMTMVGMLSAISFVLMFFDFSVPFMPVFIKMDLSELPALIGSFSLGPVAGVAICLVKNLLHLMRTSTGGVGELSNFILGASFVFTAGMIYKYKKNRKSAIIGSLLGALTMAVISLFSNYYLVYPVYTKFMPIDAIIAAYQEINPSVDGLWNCLIMFNMPFTFMKGFFSVIITLLVYKRLSPIIKGTQR